MSTIDKVRIFAERLLEEPPFRLFARPLIARLPVSVRTKAHWDAVDRPQYLAGLLAAADEARRDNLTAISAFEFGVAGGNGLLAMERLSEAVQKETGVRIVVYGFDAGTGLPELIGDHRDFPDRWREGDYPMDEEALRKRLSPTTQLIIGDVRYTVPREMPKIREPIGFVSVDVDIYSSTRDLLKMFTLPHRRMLKRVYMYFDDIDLPFTHKYAGEQLAIDEFNATSKHVKIDTWRALAKGRPFPENAWVRRMYIAHDLEAISNARLSRPAGVIELDSVRGNTG